MAPNKAKKKKKAKQKTSEPPHQPVPEEQWALPAAYTLDRSRLATLKERQNPNILTTSSLAELSEDQRAELVVSRIEAQPNFSISFLGVGTIDKQRAIAEVKARSRIGKALIEIEQKLLNDLFDRAKREWR